MKSASLSLSDLKRMIDGYPDPVVTSACSDNKNGVGAK